MLRDKLDDFVARITVPLTISRFHPESRRILKSFHIRERKNLPEIEAVFTGFT